MQRLQIQWKIAPVPRLEGAQAGDLVLPQGASRPLSVIRRTWRISEGRAVLELLLDFPAR